MKLSVRLDARKARFEKKKKVKIYKGHMKWKKRGVYETGVTVRTILGKPVKKHLKITKPVTVALGAPIGILKAIKKRTKREVKKSVKKTKKPTRKIKKVKKKKK